MKNTHCDEETNKAEYLHNIWVPSKTMEQNDKKV